MAYFTNANGERITVVINENLADFLEYVKNDKDYDRDIVISDEVSPHNFFAGFEQKQPEVKRSLASILEKTIEYSESYLNKHKEECYELAKTHPEAFSIMYSISGNRNWTRKCAFCNAIEEKAKNNSFSDNLYFIDALIGNTDFSVSTFSGKEEEIRTLPKDKDEIMAKFFAGFKSFEDKYRSNSNSQSNQRVYNSWQLLDNLIARGYFLNYNPKKVNVAGISAGEIRAEIDKSIDIKNIVSVDKKFIFDGKYCNKDLLKLVFESQLKKGEFVQTEGEQKAHDAKDMQKYIETRDLVLDAAESVVGKYIPNSRGEERTNTQKFKALIESFYNIPFDNFSGGKVVQDYLLSAAYRDINGGNAAKLADDELRLVVEHDKDGYWLKKINEKSPETAKKIIKEMNGSFSVRQSRVADVIAPEITLDHGTFADRTGNIFDTKLYKYQYGEYDKGVAESNYMSTAEKMEFLDKAAVFVDEKLLQKAKEDKAFAAEFRKDYAEHNDLCYQAYAKEKLGRSLSSLQGLYADIVQKFEDGKPNDAEAHLTEENVEKTLKDFPNCQGINLPVQGKLPLLFGRKKEEDRRIELVQRIRKFNDELMNFQNEVKNPENKWGKYVDAGEFEGEMLNRHTIEQLKVERDAFNAKVQENSQKLNNKYYGKGKYGGNYNYDDAERAEKWSELQEQRAQNIEAEKQKVLARKEQLEEAAKSVRAPETSTLQAVRDDMDKDTKAAIRESNKQIADTLEKPVTERIKKVRNGR